MLYEGLLQVLVSGWFSFFPRLFLIVNFLFFFGLCFGKRIAGEIKSFSTEGLVALKLSKRMDKFMLYPLTAGKKALADGGVTEDVTAELDKSRCGVLIGSAMGGMKVGTFLFLLLNMNERRKYFWTHGCCSESLLITRLFFILIIVFRRSYLEICF